MAKKSKRKSGSSSTSVKQKRPDQSSSGPETDANTTATGQPGDDRSGDEKKAAPPGVRKNFAALIISAVLLFLWLCYLGYVAQLVN